jgi:hypothetical protein
VLNKDCEYTAVERFGAKRQKNKYKGEPDHAASPLQQAQKAAHKHEIL